MKRRIFTRVFCGFVAVSLLAVLLFSFYALRMSRHDAFDSLVKSLTSVSETTRAVVEPLLPPDRKPELTALVHRIGENAGARVTVIDGAGIVLADSQEDAAAMENHRSRPEVAAALEGRRGTASRFSGTLQRWMVYVAVPATAPDGTGAVVRASAYREDMDAAVLREGGRIAWFAVVLLAVCVLTAIALSRTIVAPLRDLSGAVKSFAAGDFGARLHLRRRDEIRDLADSFNSMAERVQSLFAESTRRAQELDGIFSSVQQGILLLDREGRIVRCNRAFTDLATAAPVEGRTLWEVVKAPRLTELVQKARESGERQSEEIAMGERSVLCTVERMSGRDELIVVLYDTTDVRRLETVRRDFVVNASHELRTPLTSIIGSLEMLEGEKLGAADRWADAIRRNAERMSAIVEDLLLLSSLEARGVEPSAAEPLDLGRLIADVTGMFGHRAETRGIALSSSVADGLPRITADAFLIEQVLVNLVDNAIKYTEKGGVSVSCAPDAGDSVRIEVADTGIGIPAEHLSRVFERFYVVDKSRSRKMGGTGLGLAIVKHIVSSHGGTIDVRSVVGEGSRFIIRLPVQAPEN